MSRRMRRAFGALIVLLAALIASAPALASAIEVRLNAPTKVYESLSASARSVKVPKGLRVSLDACSKGWGQVTYKGRRGYIRLKYLDRVDPLKAYITENTAIYASASEGDRLGSASAGTAVYVVGVDGSFLRIQSGSGSQVGYVKAGAISYRKPGASNSASKGTGAQSLPSTLRATASGAKRSKVEMAIYIAQGLIGAPYAASPRPPRSFNCQTFVYYCYGKASKGSVKRSTKDQGYDSRYEKIAYDDLRRGDLVCFDTVSDDDLSDHTGIYLGGGYFLHSSSAAKKVLLSSLSSGYYKRTFSWGRRIF